MNSVEYVPQETAQLLRIKKLDFFGKTIPVKELFCDYINPLVNFTFGDFCLLLRNILQKNHIEQILIYKQTVLVLEITIVYSTFPKRKISKYCIFKSDFEKFLVSIKNNNFCWQKDGF